MHATLLAIPAQRQDPADEPEVRFMETAANMPPAVRTWWYPGRSIGHELIYPKDHARRLASAQTEGVLTVTGNATGDDAMRTGDLTRLGANGQETAVRAETTTAENTATQPPSQTTTATQAQAQPPATQPQAQTSTTTTTQTAATNQPERSAPAMPRSEATTPAPDTTRTAAAERTDLPRTASTLPLVALLGLASLMAAAALRFRL
jgi:cobalamin biosynthesis Mg chelatase CobN